MACKFSCFLNFTDAFKENDVGVFPAVNGDVYRVTYKSNVCRDLLLNIEWSIPKQILVTVKLYNTTYKRCFSSKGVIVNGRKTFMKMRGAFNVSNSRNYKVLCVINLIPYIKFNDCNEIPLESLEDSGFIESEFQQSSIDENISDDTETVKETAETSDDVRKNITIKINDISALDEHEISKQVRETEHQELPSSESDCQSDEIALTCRMMVEDSVMTAPENNSFGKINSEMSALLTNKIRTNSYDQCGETLKNDCDSFETKEFYQSRKNMENKKKTLENDFVENSKDILNCKSDMQTHEFMTPIDTSNNSIVKRQQDVLITKILTLGDYSEEIVENIKTLDITENVESYDYTSENNSPIESDITEMSSENHFVSYDEENILSNSNPKVNKEVSSNNISSEISLAEETECLESLDNDNRGCLCDAVKPVINSESMEANCILESNISMQNNQTEEMDVSGLSNLNVSIHSEDPDPSEIKKETPIKESKPSTTNIQKLSDVINNAEINNTKTNSYKSKSQQLPSSKTGLVFQTLVRKLSGSDFDRELTDASGVASSSDTSIKESPESESDNTIFPIMESELKGLSMDMLDLLTTGDMADASITNGEKHIKVHRAIVSARSSILKELFTKHKQDEVNYHAVVDIPSCILEDVIIFLYVGLVYVKSTKMAQDLYQVAERYGINDLIDICTKHISK